MNIKEYRFELSLRDPKDTEKYYPDDEMWNNAEEKLRNVLDNIGIEYTEKIGEAAFYGPKLDVQVKPAVGNEYTLSTCQLDFCLPMRFNLSYIDRDGQKKTPVVLHRAILGSIDRFIAFYLEETKGVLPLWLAPVQVNVIPVNNEYHLEYAKEIANKLENIDIRTNLDDREEKLGYKLRENIVNKVPINVIIGQKEVDSKLVSYRLYGSDETITVSIEELIEFIEAKIKNHN
jgi:threonyl-tRNA synthetase